MLTYLLLAFLAAPTTQPTTQPAAVTFGEPMTLGEVTPVEDVLADPAAYDGQRIRVRGEIASVCQPRGCWMRIGDEQANLFVKFTCEIDNRLVPADAAGRVGEAEGVLTVETISVEDARHFAEDAGKSPEEIAAITEPQVSLRLAGPGGRVLPE